MKDFVKLCKTFLKKKRNKKDYEVLKRNPYLFRQAVSIKNPSLLLIFKVPNEPFRQSLHA